MTRAPIIRIAVDGGGSGCRAVVCDADGTVLGRGEGPPANVATDFNAAVAALTAALDEACRDAGLSPQVFAAAPAWLGLAGAIDAATCARAADALPLARAVVTEDRVTALAGALAGADGCLAAIGTGSFLGRQASAKCRFIGGWGAVLSDEASGAWLGKQLLARALARQDGLVAATPLLDTALADLGGASAVSHFSVTATPSDFARLAPRVADSADAGDPAGQALMQAGADWIATGLTVLGWQAAASICLSGGLGPRYTRFLPAEMQAALVAPQGSPLDGAIRLALDLPG